MSNPGTHPIQQSVLIGASAPVVYDIVADITQWAQFFGPAMHAERLEESAGGDVVRRWALGEGEQVRIWTSARQLDRAALRITVDAVDPEPPVRSVRTVWSFTPLDGDKCRVDLTHELAVDGGDQVLAAVVAEVERTTAAELATLTDVAERREELAELVLSFEDPLFIAGRAEDAYEVLYEADKWPERVAHVARLEMTEPVPNIQFFDMDTKTPDGAPHTTRSVRVCLPHHKIVYKQIGLPKLLDAHTGHWLFTETTEGIIASARHTVTIKPSALSLLGEGTTVRDARRYLRNVLSANSMKNLQLAKSFAEERAKN